MKNHVTTMTLLLLLLASCNSYENEIKKHKLVFNHKKAEFETTKDYILSQSNNNQKLTFCTSDTDIVYVKMNCNYSSQLDTFFRNTPVYKIILHKGLYNIETPYNKLLFLMPKNEHGNFFYKYSFCEIKDNFDNRNYYEENLSNGWSLVIEKN